MASSDDEAPEAVSLSTARDRAHHILGLEATARNRVEEKLQRVQDNRARNRKASVLLPDDFLDALTEESEGAPLPAKKKRRKKKQKKGKNFEEHEYTRDGFHIVVDQAASNKASGRSIKFDDLDDCTSSIPVPNAASDFMALHFSKDRLRRRNNPKGSSIAHQKFSLRRSQI